MYITPIVKIESEQSNNCVYIKRDDLLPFSFGGNKVRIAQEYYADMDAQGKSCMIGYGNARSNLCRVLANMNYSRGGVCHIVSPSEDNGERIDTNNSRMVKTCDVIFHMCSKQNVSETVHSVMDECSIKGLDPYYIYGDKYGKGNEAVPVRAYVKVYQEIKQQSKDMGIDFDYIFLATGTGMTQAGLLAGKQQFGGHENIIGISVAREKEEEEKVIHRYLEAYYKDVKYKVNSRDNIIVDDDYLCGGYGNYNDEVINEIKNMFRLNGIPLDPTYTGKAYYGMSEYIKKNQLINKNILFIHTGGTPLYFDNLFLINKD